MRSKINNYIMWIVGIMTCLSGAALTWLPVLWSKGYIIVMCIGLLYFFYIVIKEEKENINRQLKKIEKEEDARITKLYNLSIEFTKLSQIRPNETEADAIKRLNKRIKECYDNGELEI